MLDGAGNAYVADTGANRVRMITPAGVSTVIAGTGTSGYSGDNGPATAATLKAPRAVAIDTSGNIFIADTGNNVIRRIDASGNITTYAGGGTAATLCAQALNSRGDGCPALQANFNAPSGLAADNLGQLYVSDTGNNVVRQISLTTNVTTLAGGASAVCGAATDTQGDGCSASQTTFTAPTGLAFDATGTNLFVADTGDNIIRKIYLSNSITASSAGIATSVFSDPVTLVAGNGQAGKSIDASSTAILSQLNAPTGVATDAAGNIYIADTGNHAVRLVTAKSGIISTIVGILGTAGTGSATGSAVAAQLSSPAGLGVYGNGTVFILDSANNRVLTDTRAQVSYDFGRTNVPTSSPVQNFTQLNTGTVATSTLAFTATGNTTQFTLTPAANSSGVIRGLRCCTRLRRHL